MFEETGASSWKKISVRRGEAYGTVTRDLNGFQRLLTIKMDSGETETIILNNVGKDDESIHEWEWCWEKNDDKKWYRF